MREFLKVLQGNDPEAKSTLDNMFDAMKKHYKSLKGKRALYYSKTDKEPKLVTILEAYNNILVLKYRVYGFGYSKAILTSTSYSALYCGDDWLNLA